MAEYKVSYESELDAFQPYFRYETPHRNEDWKTAALRGPALPAVGNAVAGAVGAAVSNVVTYPLSLIVTRLQTQRLLLKKRRAEAGSEESEGGSEKTDEDAAKINDDGEEEEEEPYSSLLDAARKIYADEGLAGLYTGLAQDTVKTAADSFLFFLAYTFLRQRRIAARFGTKRRGKHVVLPIADELAVGIMAGAFGKLFTTPLANIVTRKQTAAVSTAAARKGKFKAGTLSPPSVRQIAARIRSEKGVLGFWSGYSASLILTMNPSITLFLNELLKYVLLPRPKRQRPSAAMTFLLAALSKAAASSVTYPFSLAKTRAQADGTTMQGQTRVQQNSNGNSATNGSDDFSFPVPQIVTTVLTIARSEGLGALYAGLPGEVLKGFFSHGFTMLAKDMVYAAIVHGYYAVLVLLRRYPTPDELLQRAREQAEEYAEVVRDGARELATKVQEGSDEMLQVTSGSVTTSVDAMIKTSPSGSNETAELVADYVEDEAEEWRSLYHWFWEKDKAGR